MTDFDEQRRSARRRAATMVWEDRITRCCKAWIETGEEWTVAAQSHSDRQMFAIAEAILEAEARGTAEGRIMSGMALDAAERALRAANGTGTPAPEHGHAPMGLFELGLNAADGTVPTHECTFTLEAQRVSDVIEAALAAIGAAKGG